MAGTITTTATNVLGASSEGKTGPPKLIAANISQGQGTASATTRQGTPVASTSVPVPAGTLALALTTKLTNTPAGAASDIGFAVIELQIQGEWVQTRAATGFLGTSAASSVATAQIIPAVGSAIMVASGAVLTSGGALTAPCFQSAEAVRIAFNFTHTGTVAGLFDIAAELFAIKE